MKKLLMVLIGLVFYPAVASAGVVSIDLSGAVAGASIIAPGGSFAQTFAGQTVAGTGISGSPNNPLTLAPSGNLAILAIDPVVSPAGNAIFSEPNFQAPLSILLDQLADSITWTMGYGNPASSMDVLLFDLDGSLVNSTNISILTSYNIYTLSGLGTFAGLTFLNNDDNAGLGFMNFSYTTLNTTVPEPSTLALFATGLTLLLAFVARRRRPIRLEAT